MPLSVKSIPQAPAKASPARVRIALRRGPPAAGGRVRTEARHHRHQPLRRGRRRGRPAGDGLRPEMARPGLAGGAGRCLPRAELLAPARYPRPDPRPSSHRVLRARPARLYGRWQDFGDPGDRYLDDHHPNARDLDLFGKESLYQLLCTARTRSGKDLLAAWLLTPAEPNEVRARQAAVAELSSSLDLREDLALLGADVPAGVDLAKLAAWRGAPPPSSRAGRASWPSCWQPFPWWRRAAGRGFRAVRDRTGRPRAAAVGALPLCCAGRCS